MGPLPEQHHRECSGKDGRQERNGKGRVQHQGRNRSKETIDDGGVEAVGATISVRTVVEGMGSPDV